MDLLLFECDICGKTIGIKAVEGTHECPNCKEEFFVIVGEEDV